MVSDIQQRAFILGARMAKMGAQSIVVIVVAPLGSAQLLVKTSRARRSAMSAPTTTTTLSDGFAMKIK